MELKCWIIPLFSLFLLFHPISSYKILIYSQTLTRSHVILNARVGEALAEDGHNVTILEVEYLDPLVDFSGSSAKGVRKILVPGNFLPKSDNQSSFSKKLSNEAFNKQTIWSMIINGIQEDPKMHEAFNGACESSNSIQPKQFETFSEFLDEKVELMEQLKAEKFDLFIGEQINFCGSGLSHLLEIPIHILLVSCPIQEHVASILGLPYPISFVPSLYGIPMGDRMDIWQRFANLIGTMAHGIPFLHGVDHLTGMFRRKFGNNFPDIRDIVKESPLIFVNVDEFVDFPRPLFPNIIYIGGLGYDQKNVTDKLSQQFQNEMAKGKNGIVFFSLGSAVNTEFVPEKFKRNLFVAFAKLRDWHFLVKINAGDEFSKELANGIENVFPISSWAPQRAILAHPRTKLFITHGGYNSLMESALAGCPILSIGFFADQRRNGMVAERNGWGLAFEKEKLLEGNEEFHQKMLQILTDQKFMKGAKRLAKLLASKPFSARQMLIRHIRFLEENGGKLPELMAESRNMDTISLYNLDILALAFAFVGICIFCFIIFCRFLYLCFRQIRQQIEQLIVKKKKANKND